MRLRSPASMPISWPPEEIPVRQTTPLAAVCDIASSTTWLAPVASMMMSGTAVQLRDAARVVGAAEVAHQLGLRPLGRSVEHVPVVAAAAPEQRRQEPVGRRP